MSEWNVQIRSDASVQQTLGDATHASYDTGVRPEAQRSTRGAALPPLAAITPSSPYSKAAELGYGPLEQRPKRPLVQDPAVAAATGFFLASKEEQLEVIHELWELAKQVAPSTEFVDDFQVGNYTLAFAGLMEFFSDIWPYAQFEKLLMRLRSGWKLRSTLKRQYRNQDLGLACIDYLLRSDVRRAISGAVKDPARMDKFMEILKRNALRKVEVDDSGPLFMGTRSLAQSMARKVDLLGGPTAESPVRIEREFYSAVVLIYTGKGISATRRGVDAYELDQVQPFVRNLMTEGFIKIE